MRNEDIAHEESVAIFSVSAAALSSSMTGSLAGAGGVKGAEGLPS